MWNGCSAKHDGAVDRVTLDRAARLDAIDPAMAHALLRVAPIALRLSTDALNVALDAVVAFEGRNQVLCAPPADSQEAMTAFRERRAPQWSGR